MIVPRQRLIGSISYTYIRPPDRRSTYNGDLLWASEEVIVLAAPVKASKPLIYRDQEVIGDGYRSVWFLFKGQPWDVARFYRPDGTFTGYYADVLEPVDWRDADPGSLLPIVDLFLDLWIGIDGSHEVLDREEFEEAVRHGWVSEAQAQHARAVLHALLTRAERGDFPPQIVKDFGL